jgi:hypothetical protein
MFSWGCGGKSVPTGRSVANWVDGFTGLELEEICPVISQQGKRDLRMVSNLRLNADGTLLTWTLQRTTRPADQPIVYTLKREGYRDAFVMDMSDNWFIDGDLPEQAALITLQGVVNKEAPLLYFIYGPEWDYRFTDEIFDYYKAKKQFTFRKLRDLNTR